MALRLPLPLTPPRPLHGEQNIFGHSNQLGTPRVSGVSWLIASRPAHSPTPVSGKIDGGLVRSRNMGLEKAKEGWDGVVPGGLLTFRRILSIWGRNKSGVDDEARARLWDWRYGRMGAFRSISWLRMGLCDTIHSIGF